MHLQLAQMLHEVVPGCGHKYKNIGELLEAHIALAGQKEPSKEQAGSLHRYSESTYYIYPSTNESEIQMIGGEKETFTLDGNIEHISSPFQTMVRVSGKAVTEIAELVFHESQNPHPG